MLDVFTRAIRHPIDYSLICRITDLRFDHKIDEGNGIFSFVFTADKLPGWKAGQHSIFTLPDHRVEGKTWRPFSVAAAPHEGVIRIGTSIPETPSSFKQHLGSLVAGERVRMYGPYGELYIRPKMNAVVAVAGGIGITPFRSIIADLTHKKSPAKLTLIYSAKESHTYRDELDGWMKENPNITILYTHTAEEVNEELEQQVGLHGNNASYFLSGAPGMITAIRNKLLSLAINGSRICNDPFKGY